MSRESRQQLRDAAQQQRKGLGRGNKLRWILPLFAIAVVASGVIAWNRLCSQPQKTTGIVAKPPAPFRQPRTFKELLALSPTEIEQCDIGLINLLCAESLHGAEDLNLPECLERLDGMAKYVKAETDRHYYKFREHPEQYRNSIGYYRMMMLGTVLANDLGIRYNPELSLPQRDGKIPTLAFGANSKDLFIHGLLGGKHYGTCASMPVLVVAIGRRLDYPVNLASAKYHLYARYEERNGEHFNIEPTVTEGFMTPTDEDYRNGQFPSTDDEVRGYGFLRPLSNREALGQFLDSRGNCLGMMRRYAEAREMYVRSGQCFPDTPQHQATVEYYLSILSNAPRGDTIDELWKELEGLSIPQGPRFAYFYNRKLQIHYFILVCPERAPCETALKDLKNELAEYQKPMAPVRDSELGRLAPQGQHLLLLTLKSGKDMRMPAVSLPPPLNRGVIPPEYLQGVGKLNSEDGGLIMDALWTHYEKVTTDWTNQPALLLQQPEIPNSPLTPQPELRIPNP